MFCWRDRSHCRWFVVGVGVSVTREKRRCREPGKNHATFFSPQGTQRRWAVGPLGRWAVGPLGRWAVGPLGRWAVGPLGRWAVGPLGRWAVGPLMLSVTMLGAIAPNAEAGQWSFEAKGSYSGTQTTYNPRVNSQTTEGAPEGTDGDDFYEASAGPNQTAHINVTGVFPIIATWHPSAGQTIASDPPPSKLNYFVTSGLWGTGTTVTLDNGQGDPKNLTEEGYVNGTSVAYDQYEAGGKHLYSYDNSGHQAEVTLKTVTLMGDCSAQEVHSSGVALSIGASAIEDKRSVRLWRNGRYERAELENSEWHTYGDSIYSAYGATSLSEVVNPRISISALRSGSEWINPTAKWTWAGFDSEPAVSISEMYGRSKYGTPTVSGRVPFNFSYHGSPTGEQTFDNTCTLTDSDGATAKAYYHLTLHDPIERVIDDQITEYTVQKPYTSTKGILRPTNDVLGWPGVRDEQSATITINDEVSTETGLGVKATTEVSAFKDFLGLSAEAKYTSTHKFTLSLTTDVPKDIGDNEYKYLIAIHNFKRRHKRFFKYDEAGAVRRMISVDAQGNPVNSPYEVYHELFEDVEDSQDARWSDAVPYEGLDTTALPHTPIPPQNYDYPSGGVS